MSAPGRPVRGPQPPAAVGDTGRSAAPRLIAVGISDMERDAGVLEWADDEARATGGVIHVVHAFDALLAEESGWEPLRRAHAVRRSDAITLVSRAVQRLRARDHAADIDGSAVAGPVLDILAEFSEVVAMLVIGADEPSARGDHHVAARLAGRTDCPIVVVPRGCAYSAGAGKPVTVVSGERALPVAAVEAALDEAGRRGCSVRVVRVWHAETDVPLTAEEVAEHQLALDFQIADLQARHPGVGVVGELHRGEGLAQALRAGSALLVLDSRSPQLHRALSQADPAHCPVMVVPDSS
jgi:hypothetical protein